MIFEKTSTRTRISFEVGMSQLGGNAIFLDSKTSQIGKGETIEDTAKVLSRYADIIMIRANSHQDVESLAKNSTIPVINALTDFNHPCQLLADLLTIIEHKGDLENQVIAWIGDGNNMCHSWLNAAIIFGFKLRLGLSKEYMPNAELLEEAKKSGVVEVFYDACQAAKDCSVINTDTFISMGDLDAENRKKAFSPLQVNEKVMQAANKDAIFMHCLPAYREKEVSAGVIDGKQSVVFDQAENRLHAQKAMMVSLLKNSIA